MNQFNKIKEFVHGNLQRNETNRQTILSQTVAEDEKHVDNIKSTLTTAEKKLSNSLFNPKAGAGGQGDHGPGGHPTTDKKTKKFPSASLKKFFLEASDVLGGTRSDSVLRKTLFTCSELQGEFTENLVEFEAKVEMECLNQIQQYLNEDLPKIHRSRKQLVKASEELKTAKQKYESLTKQTTNNPLQSDNNNNKREELKNEMEAAAQKLEQCKDIYEIEIFDFLSKELAISQIFHRHMELLEEYHENMLKRIRYHIPLLKGVLQNSSQKPVFGADLEEHLRSYGRVISIVIEKCVEYLRPLAREEGLFRIPGSSTKVKRMRNAFNAGRLNAVHQMKNDPSTIVSTLKQYLRELPDPLLTSKLCDSWVEASKIQDRTERLEAMRIVCNELPEANKNNVCYLMRFLNDLTKHSERNKMSSQNLAIALGPSLLWTRGSSYDLSMSNHLPTIVEALISNCDYFFPKDSYSDLLPKPESPTPIPHTNHHNQSMSTSPTTPTSGNKKKPAPKPPSSTSPTSNNSSSSSTNLSKVGSKLTSKLSFKIKKNSMEVAEHRSESPQPQPMVYQPNISVAPANSQDEVFLRKPAATGPTGTGQMVRRPKSIHQERPTVAPPNIPPRPSIPPKVQTQAPPHSTQSQPPGTSGFIDKCAGLNHIDSDSEENSSKDSSLNSMKQVDDLIQHQQQSKFNSSTESSMASSSMMYPSLTGLNDNDEPLEQSIVASMDHLSESPPPKKPPRAHSTNSNNSSCESVSSSNLSLNIDHHQQQQMVHKPTPPPKQQKQHNRSESLTINSSAMATIQGDDNNNRGHDEQDDDGQHSPTITKTKTGLDESTNNTTTALVNQTHL